MLASLQAGRAIAALLVVLYHCGGSIFALEKYWGRDPFGHLFDFGHAGVEFFFVLSGFIILHIHHDDIRGPLSGADGAPGRAARLRAYAAKRFLRIYPIYWLILLAMLPLYLAFPAAGAHFVRSGPVLASAIALLHVDFGPSVIPVAWTLFHEVLFYALFALAILHRRIGLAAMGLWLAGSLVMLSLQPSSMQEAAHATPLGFYCSPLHMLFAFGMAASLLLRRRALPAPGWLAGLGVALFLALGWQEVYFPLVPPPAASLGYGLASAMAILGFALLERRGALRVPNLLFLLGNASYVIYLTHSLLLSVFAKMWIARLGRDGVPILLPALLLPLAALACGLLLHRWIERPMLARLGRKKQPALAG